MYGFFKKYVLLWNLRLLSNTSQELFVPKKIYLEWLISKNIFFIVDNYRNWGAQFPIEISPPNLSFDGVLI